MTTEIRIHLEGATPGLAEHRLSLKEFGGALRSLVRLIRRTASGIFQEQASEAYGGHGSRLAEWASMLDVQLGAVEQGSVVLPIVLTPRTPVGTQIPIEFPYLTAQLVLRDLEETCVQGQA